MKAHTIEPAEIFSAERYMRALRTHRDDPAAITDSDLRLLRCYHSDDELQEVIDARAAALAAKQQPPAAPSPTAPTPDVVGLVRAMNAVMAAEDDTALDAAAAQLTARCWPLVPLTLWCRSSNEKNKARNESITALELTLHNTIEKVALLEAKLLLDAPVLRYHGVFEPRAGGHSPGDCVTRNGALWVCTAPTTAVPGTAEGGGAWTMATKTR